MSRDSLVDSDSEINPMDPEYSSPAAAKRATAAAAAATTTTPTKPSSGTAPEKHVTKVKETSPIFHQFLDAAYQLLSQHPTRFEFNERFLRRLLYHLYSCQYGTFLYNTERERKAANLQTRTRSVWDYFLSRREQFLNPNYDPTVDDNQRGQERIILPKPEKIRWWSELFGRTDAEMNGLPSAPRELRSQSVSAAAARATSTQGTAAATTNMALTGVETKDVAIGPGAVAGSSGHPNLSSSSGMSSTSDATSPPELASGVVPQQQQHLQGGGGGGFSAFTKTVAALGLTGGAKDSSGSGSGSGGGGGGGEGEGEREMEEMGDLKFTEMEIEMQ